MYIDAKELLEVIRLAGSAAYRGCEHTDYARFAKRGCGACRAVIALDELRDKALAGLHDDARPLFAVMEENEKEYRG